MAAEIIICEQGSLEWHEARRGLVTASELHAVLAKGQGKSRAAYMHRLAGEIITGQAADTYSNAHMERGKEMEAEARLEYEFMTGATVEAVGFFRDAGRRVGCSPDGLVGALGLVEIKTKLPHLMVEAILRGGLPPEHRAQCQGALWITGRAWLDFVAYWPGMPLFIARVTPDADFLETLASEVAAFNDDLDATVERVRNYRVAA